MTDAAAQTARDLRPSTVARLLHLCRLGLEGCGSRSFDVFEEPAWTLSRERYLSLRVRGVVRRLHGGWAGRRRGLAIDASVIEADASRNHRVEGKLMTLPDDDEEMRPLREYFDALDEAAVAETAKTADADDDAPPGNPPSEPKFTSLTNPAAAWTNKGQMKAVFAYGTNYLIDTKEAVIVERLGGVFSIATVVEDFIDRIMIDPRLNANPRVDHHVPPLQALSTSSLKWYAGLPAASNQIQDLMITATEWDAFLHDLQQTLDKFAVPEAEQAEINAIIASTRADIVV